MVGTGFPVNSTTVLHPLVEEESPFASERDPTTGKPGPLLGGQDMVLAVDDSVLEPLSVGSEAGRHVDWATETLAGALPDARSLICIYNDC